jgi:prephenate dehydrogenase
LVLKELKQVTVIGMGLLGGSLSLAVHRRLAGVKVVGYSHRPPTRLRAEVLGVADEIANDIRQSVSGADLVVLATPICTFEQIFGEIADSLQSGCIVTDVGSTKVLPDEWAKKLLPGHVKYVGSHPIAGSEQRGVEHAREDLFDGAVCILTVSGKADSRVVKTLEGFWSAMGCRVWRMKPARHDKILAGVSHLPHVMAAALVNASHIANLRWAGPGFMDTTRIASGPPSIWADILLTNVENVVRAIDGAMDELKMLRDAIANEDGKEVTRLLVRATLKRSAMMKYGMRDDAGSQEQEGDPRETGAK